ncbi:hypothetical protein M011DRAFT_476127 [Sporormia fimetaria CBS 119925]|uniref:Uncharacterized protein n=1 Tax=Sporormia fimetaria CBS 119925 TaxID=1340428 RepID=A0A6A6VHR2_9PLEO|nr:hypothetical protein M011DRAFT_476127 [Sporormia fimetaria CBS 119925]
MLIQEDFLAPIMTTERPLQRSSWKAEAIRRGDLKISSPIPIAEESPMSEDDERARSEKLQLETRPAAQDIILPPAQSSVPPAGLDLKHEAESIATEELHPQSHAEEPVQSLRHKVSSDGLRETQEMHHGASAKTPSYNTTSPLSPLPRSATVMTGTKKRKGSIRNVFRKMFGKRSKEAAQHQEGPTYRHGHHRSEPIAIHESPKVTRENLSSARLSDMPIRELEPINPLGQHLPFPMNVNAPQEMSPRHDYLTFERPSGEQAQRRATLPSLLLAPTEGRLVHSADASPLSPQSPQIGIALSSPPPPAHSKQSKRRSRSAGALRDLTKARSSIERRRSEEIRYWRSSVQSGSVYSTRSPRPHTAQTVETVLTVDAPDAPPQVSEEMASVTGVPAEGRVHPSTTVVETFNFGDLKNGFSEEALPLPQQVTDVSEKRLSVEERVKQLEDNMRILETSVRRISGRSNRHTIILESAPTGHQYRNRTSSSSDRQSSYSSDRGSGHTLSAHKDTASSPKLAQSAESSPPEPLPPVETEDTEPALPEVLPNTGDLASQIAQLSTALRYERTSRKALEETVYHLQRELADLHAIVSKFITRSPSYPTPSPDTILTSNEERLATPRAMRRHQDPSLCEDEGNRHDAKTPGIRETIISRFSQSDSEIDVDDGSLTSSRDELASPEAWATPKEESGFGSGFFGEKF